MGDEWARFALSEAQLPKKSLALPNAQLPKKSLALPNAQLHCPVAP
jgi:hypothetical protein